MRRPKKGFIIIVIINLLIMSLGVYNVGADVDYDVSHEDSSDDVVSFDEDGPQSVTGHDDIDIISIRSTKQTVRQNVILEMTVVGKIINSDESNYNFMITDDGIEVYSITYQNGTCFGFNTDDMESGEDLLIATGAGTDTLEVTVPIKNLGTISNYDFYGGAMEFVETDEMFYMYMDQVPDDSMPWYDGGDGYDDWEEYYLAITEPTNGTTLYETCTIEIISGISFENDGGVEIQIDSKSSSGWDEADMANGDSSTWEYKWDTEAVSDGKHEIHARVYDGIDYYYDTKTVFVDQKTATEPKTATMPTFKVGDRFEYDMKFNFNNDDMGLPPGASVSGSMNFEFNSIDTLKLDGQSHEVYVMKVKGETEMSSGPYSQKSTMEGTFWMRTSDLAMLKEETRSQQSGSGGPYGGSGDDSYHDISTYDPPDDKFNFPLKVSEKWIVDTILTSEFTETYDGETYSDSYIESITKEYECLRTETVTVPAGTFEAFLIHCYEDYGMYDDDEDSDGDGWYDYEEEYYGTDPEDPEDYPEDEYDVDSDGDGWDDWEEEEFGTDPDDSEDYPEDDYYEDDNDSDDDGWDDWEEEDYGTDPEDPEDYPEEVDSDGDGWYDYEEEYYDTDPEDPNDNPDSDYYYDDYVDVDLSCTIEYVSPEIGFYVKVEEYDYDGQLIYTIELESYKFGDKVYDSQSQAGRSTPSSKFELGITYLLGIVLIIIIILIGIALAKRRRTRRLEARLLEKMRLEAEVQAQARIQAPSDQNVKFEPVVEVGSTPVEVEPVTPVEPPRQFG